MRNYNEGEPENLSDRLRKAREQWELLLQYMTAKRMKRDEKELRERSMNQPDAESKTNPLPSLDYRNSFEKKNN